ncbi:Alpha/Beta hydrolase protein, partial [Coemansia spiralis]
WTCAPECQHPGTEGTVVDHLWNIPLITSSGYIAHNPNKNIIVVAFRGSQSLGDWAQSFTAVPTLWPASIADSVVNTGFLTGYIVAKPLIIQNIADLAQKYPEYLILVTGHSLGGSRAAMLVADLALGYPNLKHRLQLYTYGQAKCGNKVFADLINGLGIPVVRVVNRGDIVPKLPIEESVYAHFGTEAWYDFNNDTVVCTT